MFKLRKYLKGYWGRFFIGPLFKFLEAVFELIVPLVMIKIMDVGIVNNDTNYIWKMGLVLFILGVVGLCFSLTCQYFASVVSQGFAKNLRHDLFKHINEISFSDIDKYGTSHLITRITNDIYQAQTGIAYVMRLVVRSPFIVVGSIVAAVLIDPVLGIVFCVIGPIISVLLIVILSYITKQFKKIQKRLDHISLVSRENLSGVRVVRSFSKQEEEIERFEDSNEEFTKANLRVSKIQAYLNPLTFALINIAIVFIMYYGGLRVDSGYITQGELIAFINQVSVAVVAMANLFVLLSKGNASSERIYSLLSIEPKIISGLKAFDKESQVTVQFQDVFLNYTNSNDDELENITFTLNKGEMVGIIGGTGSGKSSIINMIPRFYDAKSGIVKVSGIDVKEMNLQSLRENIGIVPQKSVLYSGTVASNLKWGKSDATVEEMTQALKIAQAYDFVMEKEDKLDTVVLRGGKNFSGGQKQRLCIARALIRKPSILILDDSSSALDFKTDRDLRMSLRENLKDQTVIIVTQRCTSIMDCDKILVIDDGKIEGIGTHEELLKTSKVYQDTYYSQVKEGKSDE